VNDPDDISVNVAVTEEHRVAAAVMNRRYRIKHPDFSTPEARLATFHNPFAMIPRGQNIDTLVDAGFFLVGKFILLLPVCYRSFKWQCGILFDVFLYMPVYLKSYLWDCSISFMVCKLQT